MSQSRCVVVALAVALVGAGVAESTILIRRDLAELVKDSELIISARVLSNVAAWDKDRKLIWTTTRLEVRSTLKGTAVDTVDIRELGGEVGSVGMGVAGAPRYRVGDNMIVCLKKDVLGQWRTYGWTQGQFRIDPDPTKPDAFVVVASFPHVVDGYFPRPDGTPVGPIAITTFTEKVRSLVAAAEKHR